MKIGIFQFSASDDVAKNHAIIANAIIEASKQKVRMLVFQECALCGCPPFERPNASDIDFEFLEAKLQNICNLAKKHNMHIALGSIRKENNKHFNTMHIINSNGSIMGNYDKRALWGYDKDNFESGSDLGIYEIDGIKMGFRICFEVRFPEYFRELFKAGVELCFVGLWDNFETDSIQRYNIIKSHLVTRAVENLITVVSINGIQGNQTAPTAVFHPNGDMICEAPKNQQHLLVYDYKKPDTTFGMQGRKQISCKLL